jgi:hypothetical protein
MPRSDASIRHKIVLPLTGLASVSTEVIRQGNKTLRMENTLEPTKCLKLKEISNCKIIESLREHSFLRNEKNSR